MPQLSLRFKNTESSDNYNIIIDTEVTTISEIRGILTEKIGMTLTTEGDFDFNLFIRVNEDVLLAFYKHYLKWPKEGLFHACAAAQWGDNYFEKSLYIHKTSEEAKLLIRVRPLAYVNDNNNTILIPVDQSTTTVGDFCNSIKKELKLENNYPLGLIFAGKNAKLEGPHKELLHDNAMKCVGPEYTSYGFHLYKNIFLEKSRLAFLCGFHPRLGEKSAIYNIFLKNSLTDPKLCKIIFEMLDVDYRYITTPKILWNTLSDEFKATISEKTYALRIGIPGGKPTVEYYWNNMSSGTQQFWKFQATPTPALEAKSKTSSPKIKTSDTQCKVM